MPIIATIFSGLFFWACYWFFYLDGHKKIEAAFSQRRDSKRRMAALESQARAPVKSIIDPRDGAIVLMYLVARQKGDYTAAQLSAIEEEMRSVLSLSGEVADRHSYARYAVSKTPSVTAAIQDLAPLFNDRLTPEERQDLFDMIDRIANVDGSPNDDQSAALAALRKRLAPPGETGEGFGWTKPRG